jgi:hypothetical protein
MMLPKDNMAGDAKAMSNRIITSISFLSFAITKEATKTRTRLEFVVFMRLKKDEIGRAKGIEDVDSEVEIRKGAHKESD